MFYNMRRILKSGSRKASKEDCAASCSQDELNGEADEDVEHCKKVSTAKAMFENMVSTPDHRLKKVKSKPKLKSWNSSSLLDNTSAESAHATPTTPTTITTKFYAHAKSKSEPVELTSKDYERLSNRRDIGEIKPTYEDNLSLDRCASANDDYIEIITPSPLETSCPANFLKNISSPATTSTNQDIAVVSTYRKTDRLINASPSPPPTEFTTTTTTTTKPPPIVHRTSRSEIVSSSTHAEIDIQMAALPSYSSEDLRHYGKDAVDTSKGSGARQTATPSTLTNSSASAEVRQQTANSANDLREATQRYYTHVARNNPRLRNAIPGKDPNNAMKFTHARKSSSPCEEEFLRGGTRATIATSTSVASRLGPRSKSTIDPPPQPQTQVELSELSDMLSRTCEQNSIMSRLLRGENSSSSGGLLGNQHNSSNSSASTLMQIPEENKNASASSNTECDAHLVRSRNRSDCSESTSATSEVLLRNRGVPYGKNANTISSRSCTSINMTAKSEINDERSTHADTQRLHHYRGAKSTGSIVPDMNAEQVQTEARLRRGGNTTTGWMSGSTENVPGTGRSKYQISRNEHGSLQGLSSSSREMLEQEETRASNESIDSDQHIYDVPTIDEDERIPNLEERTLSTSDEAEGISHDKGIDNDTPVTSTEVYVETDIDADETSPLEIVHKKDLSTDSAVYVLDEHVSHAKALSNVSNDSTHDTEKTSPLPYQRYEDDELSSPLPSNDGVLYDYPREGDDSIEKEKEKEKPQRTISRRKKDSSHANSRNNSCVSTDSCASTGTMDSGIVVTESQRTSPMSDMAPSSYYDKELNGSRETLDADIVALEKASELNSSTSVSALNRDENAENAAYQLLGVSRSGSVGSNSSSRESGGRAGELDSEKAKLVESMREKINELRDQEAEIADEIRMNEDLGKKVQNMVQTKATQVEFGKFELFIGELNKVVALLLSLTQRLHRYELMLQDLDMADEEDQVKKEGLITKIDKLKSQHEEACYLRDVNDKRGDVVAVFLENYCTEEEFADFQYYVDMKSQLALMQSEIREKVKLGDARLKALELTNSEWSFK